MSLKPCPLCGSDDVQNDADGWKGRERVVCNDCCLQLESFVIDDVVAHWNQRAATYQAPRSITPDDLARVESIRKRVDALRSSDAHAGHVENFAKHALGSHLFLLDFVDQLLTRLAEREVRGRVL